MSTFFPTTFFISKNIDNSNKDEILIEFFEEVLGKKTIELYKNFNSLFKKTQILKNNKCNINTISTKMQLSIEEIKNFQCSLEAFGLISVFKNVLDNSITVVINEIPDFSVISSNILLNSFIKKKIGLEKYEEYKSYFSHPFKDKTNFEDISTTAESFLNVNEYDISFIQDEAINKLLCSYFKMPIKYNDELNKIIVRMKKEFSIEKTTELLIASANIVQNMVEIDTKVLEEKANINRNIIQPLKTNTVYRNPKIWTGECNLQEKEKVVNSYFTNTPQEYLQKIYKINISNQDSYTISCAQKRNISDEMINITIDYAINVCKYQYLKSDKINSKYFTKVCDTIISSGFSAIDQLLLHFIKNYTKGAIVDLPWNNSSTHSTSSNNDISDSLNDDTNISFE